MPETAAVLRGRYIDLLKHCVTRAVFPEQAVRVQFRRGSWQRAAFEPLAWLLSVKDYMLYKRVHWNPALREGGFDWPAEAETMIGLKRLSNVQECLTKVIEDDVPGDVIETGVWRGGTCILMKGILRAYGDSERVLWVADSFEGVPRPNPTQYPADAAEGRTQAFWKFDQLAVPLETVQGNFQRYGLLDERVQFLKGWFKDTLPTAPIKQLALL